MTWFDVIPNYWENPWSDSWDCQVRLLALSRWKILGPYMTHSLRGETHAR